jgi:ribosomal protein L1
MNEDSFNMDLRKFLKKVGVTSQREIEQAVREALESGKLKGHETLKARVTLTIEGLDLKQEIDGSIALG